MSGFEKVVPCAAVAAVVFLGSLPLNGQSPAPIERHRSYALAGFEDTLPAALSHVDTMLVAGELDVAGLQDDTMIPGRVHERLGQFYGGLPVFGAQAVRQMDGRSIVSITGRLYEGITLDINPAISPEKARAVAIASSPPGSQIRGETTLGVLAGEDRYRLVYKMEVRSDWTIRDVYVDAETADIARSVNRIHSQGAIGQGAGVFGTLRKMSTNQTSSTYQAADKLRPADAFTLDFRGNMSRLNLFVRTGSIFNSDIATDSDNSWNDAPTVDAHVYQGWVYDYFFKRFGRRGMDDRDIEVDSVVHPLDRSQASRQPDEIVNTYINNAFYCCDGLLVFGDGDGEAFTYLAGGFDVVAHEWTHGVTDFSSQLIYRDEPGALNEAFSDIMAVAMEFYYQPVGTGIDRADWQIGEDVYLRAPGYLRALNNPAAGGEPDHYSLRRFIGTTQDDGGVHFNMTIVTHAFYLAVAGGRNRVSRIEVAGIGFNNIERMERIFYRAFVMLMAPNSQFSDARRATLQAAADLYGAGSNDRSQLEQAWTAVGVN